MFAVAGSRNAKHASCLFPPSSRSLAYRKWTLSRSHVRIKHSRETVRSSHTLWRTMERGRGEAKKSEWKIFRSKKISSAKLFWRKIYIYINIRFRALMLKIIKKIRNTHRFGEIRLPQFSKIAASHVVEFHDPLSLLDRSWFRSFSSQWIAV